MQSIHCAYTRTHVHTHRSTEVYNSCYYRRRVRVEKGGGAWCPRPAIQHNVREWLEVALPSGHGPYLVTASETQGRFGNGQGQEFAEAFIIEYWRHHLGRWVTYKNANSHQVISTLLSRSLLLIRSIETCSLIDSRKKQKERKKSSFPNELDIAGQQQSMAGCCPATGSSASGRTDTFPALQSSSAHHLHASRDLRLSLDRYSHHVDQKTI